MLVRFDLLDGEAGHPALFLKYSALANSTLFLFNLLPVPMLDGWSIIGMFFPPLLQLAASTAQTISWLVLFALIATPLGTFIWRCSDLLADLFLRLAAVLLGHG